MRQLITAIGNPITLNPLKDRGRSMYAGAPVHTTVCNLREECPQFFRLLVGGLALVTAALLGCGNENKGGISKHISALDQPSTVSISIDGNADLTPDQAQVVLQGPWGRGDGEFSMRDEASRPGPMSLVVDGDRTIYILDQVNRRVARFDGTGRLMGYLSIDSETTEDIAVADGKIWAVEYQPGENPGFGIVRYGEGGKAQQFKLDRSIQLVTGIFLTGEASAPDVWVEQRHDGQSRVVLQGNVPSKDHPLYLPGRPDRSVNGLRLDARRLDSHSALVSRFVPGEATLLRLKVGTRIPLVSIHALQSDQDGNVHLGLVIGRDGGPPEHQLVDFHKLMVVHCITGKTVTVELAPQMATDAFRPVTVGHDGSVYQMETTTQGVTVRRWDSICSTGE